MQIADLAMPPFNTTMMGVLKGVTDHFKIPLSAAKVFGGSGHAFLMNVHEDLCPSGPYCWNREPALPLVRNLGVEMLCAGRDDGSSGPEDRATIEDSLRQALDAGLPCSLLNMENQLITGYDDSGFTTAQPWPGMDFPPARLTFGSWCEFGNEIHVLFSIFRQVEPAPEEKTLKDSLAYAVDLYRNPASHSGGAYAVGDQAYVNWLGALRNVKTKGQPWETHGRWWNGMVWSECRSMAAAYLDEIASSHPEIATEATALAEECRAISAALAAAGDKEAPVAGKISRLEEARDREARSIDRLELLLRSL